MRSSREATLNCGRKSSPPEQDTEEVGVGAVVINSRGLSAIEQVAMDNFSESVADQARCSVLVVCAEGLGT